MSTKIINLTGKYLEWTNDFEVLTSPEDTKMDPKDILVILVNEKDEVPPDLLWKDGLNLVLVSSTSKTTPPPSIANDKDLFIIKAIGPEKDHPGLISFVETLHSEML